MTREDAMLTLMHRLAYCELVTRQQIQGIGGRSYVAEYVELTRRLNELEEGGSRAERVVRALEEE